MNMTVERISYLHENQISDFMYEIQHTLRPGIEADALAIRRAVTLVRNNAITSYRYGANPEDFMISLEGGVPADVRLSFDRMETACTCGSFGWCSHRIATVFHLYSQFHSLTDWLHEWRRAESQQLALSISERTPDAWIDVLSRLTQPLRTFDQSDNPGIFIHESSLIDQKAIPLTPFEWEWKPLFELYYRLHLLDAGWAYIQTHLNGNFASFQYGKWYIQNWLIEQLDKLQACISAIGAKPKLFETDAFHERLKELVRTFALRHPGLFEKRFQVYRLFWEHLYPNPKERATEMTILSKDPSEEARIFIAFFHLMQGNHEEVKELAKDMDANHVELWLPLAQLAEGLEEIETLSVMMHAISPFIGEYVNNAIAVSNRPLFVRTIDGLLEAADFPEKLREEMFSQYGTAGVDVYADFLVERERFAEWAALMHRYGVSLDSADAGGLKLALAKDPVAVIPLLHTYAMKCIQEKNRHSYRRAVKLFKKMKTGAKKSGKIDFWNQYIDTVREKNRRLRALMEEMEKGNLNL
ncbi:hypothetical protein ACFPRA_09610 [Sporosarcina soli]|uniref:SWIM-type domain-containing protein n=1 Tax=Sporosarcina soli TaxID=334736 RepID=A0ABW0TJI6_9BACL